MMDEITADFAVAEVRPSAELQVRPRVTIAAKTDLGRVRENNEDKHEFYIPEDSGVLASRGMAFVVCDGMGGHAAGQIASELACKTFLDVYYNHPSEDASVAATSAVLGANRFVLDVARAIPSRRGMGTTLTALILIQDRALLVHVGDSRLYRLRGGELAQISRDHTWLVEAIELGLVSPEDAELHPNRHALLRAVGTEPKLDVDCDWLAPKVDDIYLLCSDGLDNHVSDAQIHETLLSNPPAEAAWKLVSQALIGGGSDNCTVLVVRVDALERV